MLLAALGQVMVLAMLATWAGSLMRSRLAPISAVLAGASALGLHLYCGLGGHVSMTAGFWLGQLAVIGAISIASTTVLAKGLNRS